MVRYYRITAIRTGEPEIIGSFSQLYPDEIIGWGSDGEDPEGIKRWRVEYEIV